MKLRKLAKDAGSGKGGCPALYVAEDNPAVMSAQGKRPDADTIANLEDVTTGESAVLIPTETVLRAVGRLLAEHGRPGVAEEIEAYLAEQEL